MLSGKRAQSTAEYAITVGVVIAVVAGVMSVALKGGLRNKVTQGVNLLQGAGTVAPDATDPDIAKSLGVLSNQSVDGSLRIYEGEARHTVVGLQENEQILKKGGAMTSSSNSSSNTSSFNYEAYNAINH
jgi:hypothetical protein